MTDIPSSSDEGDSRAIDQLVDRAYRLILGRRADAVGAAGYIKAVREGTLTLSQVCASLASSPEFANRLQPPGAPECAPADPDLIDVAELIGSVSVEEHAARAEAHFKGLEFPEWLLRKPFLDVAEAPFLLAAFGQVLGGLELRPDMTVLDFGAGTCWTSRWLTQLGMRVIALDVSETVLALGKRLFELEPVLGQAHAPQFLHFDGRRIELADGAVDRVLSFGAFHHVPNPSEVLGELARVLRPGGIAAFSEPGPGHSVTAQSQSEMRNYGVIENDVVIEDVWTWAKAAGFAELRLRLVDPDPRWVDLETFQDVLAGEAAAADFVEPARVSIGNHRMFQLRRGDA